MEAQTLMYVMGGNYDLYLTVGLLNNLAGWADAPIDPEAMAVFSEHGAAQRDILDQSMASMQDASLTDIAGALSGAGLESCTEEQHTGLTDALGTLMDDIDTAKEQLEGDPVGAFALSEGVSFTFSNGVFGQFAFSCAENYEMAWFAGAILSEMNIVAGLYANAAVEQAAGDADVAAFLTESADTRMEALNEMLETLSSSLVPAE